MATKFQFVLHLCVALSLLSKSEAFGVILVRSHRPRLFVLLKPQVHCLIDQNHHENFRRTQIRVDGKKSAGAFMPSQVTDRKKLYDGFVINPEDRYTELLDGTNDFKAPKPSIFRTEYNNEDEFAVAVIKRIDALLKTAKVSSVVPNAFRNTAENHFLVD